MKKNLFKLMVLYFKLKAQNHHLQHKYSILCKKKKQQQKKQKHFSPIAVFTM